MRAGYGEGSKRKEGGRESGEKEGSEEREESREGGGWKEGGSTFHGLGLRLSGRLLVLLNAHTVLQKKDELQRLSESSLSFLDLKSKLFSQTNFFPSKPVCQGFIQNKPLFSPTWWAFCLQTTS